ncbi:hypothetical protein NBRC116592_03600 [Colwellia sp. KU-HH00111]|uniref:hypothetical protein n=1 Tax=Colwellia sp. KU-HH00111 TaxID=3127652 RepID=UPI00310C6535
MIIGIDPGLQGAVAILSDADLVPVHDMPTKKVGKKKKIDGSALRELIKDADHVCLEDVVSRPGQGIVSAFTFGEGFGLIKGVCESLGIPYLLVRPSEWQKLYGLNTGTKDKSKKKKEIANKCLSFYPKANLYGPKGGLKDGRSDAIMIARYALN